MPNPNKPSYGRLQIDTTNKVEPVVTETAADVGNRGRGGMKSGGFKFAQDSNAAYRVPDSLLNTITDNAGGVIDAVDKSMQQASQWAAEADQAAEDDRELQIQQEMATDDYIAATAASKAARIKSINSKFDGGFITDKAKNRQLVRDAQATAAVKQGEGLTVINSYATQFENLENLDSPAKIAMYSAMLEDADDILDPELRRSFQTTIDTTKASMASDMEGAQVAALKEFETRLGKAFPTKEEIDAADYPDRATFVRGSTSADFDVWNALPPEQQAMGQVFFESIAGDIWDQAQTATGRQVSLERSLETRELIGTPGSKPRLASILTDYSAPRGIAVLAEALSSNTALYNKPDQARAEMEDLATTFLSGSPARFQEFMQMLDPKDVPEAFAGLRTAANGTGEEFAGYYSGMENAAGALTFAVATYSNRVVSGAGRGQTRNGTNMNGTGTLPTAEDKVKTVVAAERDATRRRLANSQGVDETTITAEQVNNAIVLESSSPNAGMMIPMDDNYNETTIPRLTNAVFSLPAGHADRAVGLDQLRKMDDDVGSWMEGIMELEGGTEVLAELGLAAEWAMWKQERALEAAGGERNAFAPGQLAANMVDVDLDAPGTYGLGRLMQEGTRGLTSYLTQSKFFTEDGVRVFTDFTEAAAMTQEFVDGGFDSPDAASASPYATAMRHAFKGISDMGGIYKDDGHGSYTVDMDAVTSNPSLRYAVPSIASAALIDGGSIGTTSLAVDMVKAILPPHVAGIYDRGNLMVKNGILKMTQEFFANTKDITSPDSQEFMQTFGQRLQVMMAASSDPSTQKRGLAKINGAPVEVTGVISESMISQMYGRSTRSEADHNEGAWVHHNAPSGRMTGETTMDDGSVQYDPSEDEYRDDAYFTLLDKLHGPYDPLMHGDDEDTYRQQQVTAHKRHVDTTATSAIIRHATLNDPAFAETIVTALSSQAGDADVTIAGVLGMYFQNNNVAVMQRPIPGMTGAVEVSRGITVSNSGWEVGTEGAAVAGLTRENGVTQDEALAALQFDVVITPTTEGKGSLNLIDGSSQYSSAQSIRTDKFEATWGSGGDFESALGYTNSLSRRFLDENQVTTLGNEVTTRISKALKIPRAEVAKRLYPTLAGGQMTLPGLDVEADQSVNDVNEWLPFGMGIIGTEHVRRKTMELEAQGIDPFMPVGKRTQLKQFSAERGVALLSYVDALEKGDASPGTLAEAIRQISELTATDEQVQAGPDDNSDTQRQVMFNLKHGGTMIEMRRLNNARSNAITDPATIAQINTWLTSGHRKPQAISADPAYRMLEQREPTRPTPVSNPRVMNPGY